jgi:isocitrate dehydrogenase kinase/phosphatase
MDLYIRDADEGALRHCVKEYGAAIKELASANIFPGDMLLKNFGVTRYGRVVFYDYDEIALLTEVNFRRLPEATSDDEETAAEPWFSVSPNDIFMELHADLADPAFWIATQDRIRDNIQDDVFPYPQDIRFRSR